MKKNKKISFLLVLIIGLFTIFEIYGDKVSTSLMRVNKESDGEKYENIADDLNIYFIDVGQADSILIKENNEYMLIDAGNNNDGKKLVNYFKNMGIKKFKYIVGTHPHEDHIGGLDDIINNFEIENIYLPNVITTTRTFEDVLEAMENKKLEFNVPKKSDVFNLGEANFKVIHIGTDANDLNNTSIVLKMVFGENSFLFMGDATSKVEKDILNDDLKADVLKVGHHGSRYSSTNEFLDVISSKYAIISCGENNSYGHPHQETLKKLNDRNIKVYRTDENGTIIVTSNGKELSFNTEETDTNG